MKTTKIILIFIIITCFYNKLLSQNNVEIQHVKSLQECIQQALNNNLTLKSERLSVEKTKDLQITAFNIEKMNFSLSQDPTSGGSPDNSFSISQNFEFPTIYVTRRNLLKAETEVEKSRLQVSENEIIKEISIIYYNLLFVKEKIKILQQQNNIYEKFLFLASSKLKSGETGKLEQINAEKLYNENKIAIQNTEKNYQNLQLLLQNLLNSNEIIAPKEDSLTIISEYHKKDNWDVSQTPQNKIFESQILVGEKNLSLQRQGFIPDINFSLRSQLLINSFNPYNIPRNYFDKGNFMGFEVGISIPLFFGEQQAKAKTAKKEVEIIRLRQQNALQSIQKSYETALNEYETAKTNLDYFQQIGNNQAKEITKISQLLYENGEIGYIEYIQNLKTAVEMNLEYTNAINEYNQTIIVLNYLESNE